MSDVHEPSEERPPLVPRDAIFEGQVAVVGETVIAGAVRGTLRGPGALRLDPGSRVEGVVDCGAIECRGSIIGPVTALQRVHLAAGTRLEGDLDAPAIRVDDDAVWIGTARVGR